MARLKMCGSLHNFLSNVYRRLFLEPDHLPPFSAEVKKASYISTPPSSQRGA
jgi:hypothetical protein